MHFDFRETVAEEKSLQLLQNLSSLSTQAAIFAAFAAVPGVHTEDDIYFHDVGKAHCEMHVKVLAPALVGSEAMAFVTITSAG